MLSARGGRGGQPKQVQKAEDKQRYGNPEEKKAPNPYYVQKEDQSSEPVSGTRLASQFDTFGEPDSLQKMTQDKP